ncbi:alcohol dehydrogenase catalytic domain-containing protein [Streptomyces sp. NPDC004609]|uniref:alcohol dehydrogenase catalytic domain-containing protein n=1 Tax=Streptomyces sp. NPDC004609 TaxID=3364704 RepID=UPI0036C037F2
MRPTCGGERPLYELAWRPVPQGAPETDCGLWVVLGAKDGQASRIAAAASGNVAFHESLDGVLAGQAPRHLVLCLDDFVTAGPDLLTTVGAADRHVLEFDARLGSERAGVVLEVAGDVTGLVPGDRVTGIFSGTFGCVAVADHRLLTPVPDGWSFAEAASVPSTFLTANYALFHVLRLRKGRHILIHAAAGGVGMAAVQPAQHVGAGVHATASPAK